MNCAINEEDKSAFEKDGFVIIDNLIDSASVPVLHTAFEQLFNGQFETGVKPDEVNWQYGSGDPSLTRQICNGWKANRTVASVVLSQKLGAAIGSLTNWFGVRIMIDNVLWKPPGAKSLGFHQDSAYLSWFAPNDLITCWIALDNTSASSGTMELVKGSHRWPRTDIQGEFHAPENYKHAMQSAARVANATPEIVPVEVNAGGGSFHHGWTWHGSGCNSQGTSRRALVLHAMKSSVEYVPANFHQGIGPIYSRYKRLHDNIMDEQFFPIIWQQDGYRTPDIDQFINSVGVQ